MSKKLTEVLDRMNNIEKAIDEQSHEHDAVIIKLTIQEKTERHTALVGSDRKRVTLTFGEGKGSRQRIKLTEKIGPLNWNRRLLRANCRSRSSRLR